MNASPSEPQGSSAEWDTIVPRALTVDGDRVVYRQAGQGPVLLLVHGMAGSSVTWKHVMPAFARRFTVLAPDLLGQGASDRPRSEYSLGAYVNTLRDLMDVLGHQRATVIGQSFGGGVALQFAYQFPERCERLVLVDSGGFGREVTWVLRFLALPGAEHFVRWAFASWVRATLSAIGAGLVRLGARATPSRQEMWRSYASLADADSRRAFFRSLRNVIEPGGQALSVSSHLPSIRSIPAFILWGASDPFIPVSHAHAAHHALPGSRVLVFDDVGHYPHCEAPTEFVDAALDFIATTAPARLPARSSPRSESPAGLDRI